MIWLLDVFWQIWQILLSVFSSYKSGFRQRRASRVKLAGCHGDLACYHECDRCLMIPGNASRTLGPPDSPTGEGRKRAGVVSLSPGHWGISVALMWPLLWLSLLFRTKLRKTLNSKGWGGGESHSNWTPGFDLALHGLDLHTLPYLTICHTTSWTNAREYSLLS